jgi:hypothetical protein
MKKQTTLITSAIALCLTLWALASLPPANRVGAAAPAQTGTKDYPPPSTTVCGVVTEFQAASAVSSGVLTIGGVRFQLAAGSGVGGFTVGANVCATFCFDAAGQIVTLESAVTANAGATKICGIVNAFEPFLSLEIGGAKLRLVPGTWLQGQSLVAPGVNLCLTPVYDGQGNLISGSAVTEAPNTAQVRIPALVHGRLLSDNSEDIFRLPQPFVLNVPQPVPATASVSPVTGYFYTPYPGFKQQGIYQFSYSTPNSAVRAYSCGESLWDLFFQIKANQDTVDDMVTLSLQKPDGSGSFVVAMFTTQSNGVVLTQLASDVKLFAFAQGEVKVGTLVPFHGDTVERQTQTLTLVFSPNSARLMECLQYCVEIKRGAWAGTTSVIHIAAVVKRIEQFGDRDGSNGESLTEGEYGWFPTGLPCALACNACLPPPPVQPLPGSLSGYVYCDKNDDGIFQAGEPALSGVTVTLTGTDINGAVNKTTATDANGFYIFKDLMPGVFKITEAQPANTVDGKDTVGTLGGDTTNDMFANIALPAAGIGANYNFGEKCDVSTPTPTPTPNNSKCDTVCWRSTQYLLNNLRAWPSGTVLAAGYNANNPMGIQGNLANIRNILQGGPSVQQRLNREFVTAQMSLAMAGGSGSPVVFNTFWSPLRCSQVSFTSVTLSNGLTFTPESLLDTLMNQTVQAIRENRQQDYDELANLWALINGKCGF